jgi:uncharacterized protein
MESKTSATAFAATDTRAAMVPIAAAQRIEALDVVRGFALIGIFLMNIEFFNRPIATLGLGMPRGLTGADWWASWFVYYFVQGKFWTIFSLLFGMGFAVMMLRAEQAGREFKRVYLRRVLALAVFGAAHYIFLWDGDILLTYAIAALLLMVALHGKTKPILLAIAVLIGLGLIPDQEFFFAVAGGVASAGLIALFLRSEKHLKRGGQAVPIFAFLVLSIGVLVCVAAIVFWLLPDGPIEPRLPLSVMGPLLLIAGWLSWKYHQPAAKRALRLGVSLYLFGGIAMTVGGLVVHFAPEPYAQVAVAPAASPSAPRPASAALAATAADKKAEPKPAKTKAEKAAEYKAEREKRLAEGKAKAEKEVRIYTQGSYGQAVELRASAFVEKVAQDFGMSVLFIGVFLLGGWFVRSGVMENSAAHMPLFRKLALYGLTIGIGIGLLSSLIAMSHTRGDRSDGWGIALGLLTLGNLAACVGYVGLVVLMLNSKTPWSKIGVLAAPGRMALTNYLMQSLICAIYFHGYALGHWGMPRAQQVLFVAVVFAAQIAFSHWWLSKFRYGPLEWFWRGFTYRQTPKFRL